MVLWLEADDDVPATGTWEDKSGENNDCSLVGNAYVDQGEGIILDGNGDRGFIDQADELDFGSDNDFSISLWFKTTSESYPHQICYGEDDSQLIRIMCAVGTGYYTLDDDSDTLNGSTGSTALNDGNWHHHVMSCDRDGNIAFYRDNVKYQKSMTSIDNLTNSTYPNWIIGALRTSSAGYSNDFDGTIDDIRIYSEALIPIMVKRIYDHGDHNT